MGTRKSDNCDFHPHWNFSPRTQPNEAAQHQSGGPAGVENVQVMGSVAREESGDQGIGNGFECAIRHRKNERAPIEELVGGGSPGHPARGGKGHKGREEMEHKGGDDELPVAEFVADDAADDDAKTKAGEPGAGDVAEFLAGEAKFGCPVGEDATPEWRPSPLRRRGWP